VSRSAKQTIAGLGFFAVVLVVIAAMASNAAGAHGLRAVILSGRRAEPDVAIPITVSVRDTQGAVTRVVVDFGDGHVEEPAVPPGPCVAPLTRQFDLVHAFSFTGYTTVKATVVTGGCGAKTEKVESLQTIEVRKVDRP
jgi:hypothetical protein